MLRTFNVKVLLLGYFPLLSGKFPEINFKWGIPLQFARK